MSNLTVLAAAPGMSRVILSVLQDWSAAGLLQPFLWVPTDKLPPTGDVGVPALLVADGQVSATMLSSYLADHPAPIVRVGIVNPLRPLGPDSAVVSFEAEARLRQAVVDVRERQSVQVVRCLITVGGNDDLPVDLARNNIHTLLLSPETSADPLRGIEQLGVGIDNVTFANHAAAGIAGIYALWNGVEEGPFDRLNPPPGATLRLVRSHLRQADGGDLDSQLRAATFNVAEVPQPLFRGQPAPYFPDQQAAINSTAAAVYQRHAATFQSTRLPLLAQTKTKVGAGEALRMFFSFLGKALIKAPGSWAAGLLADAKRGVANYIQQSVFGGDASMFSVIGSGQMRAARPHEAALAVNNLALRYLGQEAPPNLSHLWQSYINGGMDLMDAGGRLGLELQLVGGVPGVVRKSDEVAPAPSTTLQFDPSLHQFLGRTSIEAFDYVGIGNVSNALNALAQDPTSPVRVAAGSDLQRLGQFHQQHGSSYASYLGYLFANQINGLTSEVEQTSQQLGQLSQVQAPDDELARTQAALRRELLITSVVSLLAIILFIVLGTTKVFDWVWVIVSCLVLLLAWFGLSMGIFMARQKRLFQLLNMAKKLKPEVERLTANLKYALADLRRTWSAYSQFLEWSRVLSAFVHQPFGTAPEGAEAVTELPAGMPKNVRLGRLRQQPEQLARTKYRLRSSIFTSRWLDRQWDLFLDASVKTLGAEAIGIDDPKLLFTMHPDYGRSPLEKVAANLVTQGVPTSVGDERWAQQRQLMEAQRDMFELNTAAIESSAGAESQETFLGSLAGADKGQPLASQLLQESALVQGWQQVDDGAPWRVTLPSRLGVGVARVEWSRAFDPGQLKEK